LTSDSRAIFRAASEGEPRSFADCNVAVLVGTCIRELLAQLRQPAEQSCPLLCKSVGLEFERLRIGLGQPVGNGTDRALELHTTVEIVFQQTYTQGTQLGTIWLRTIRSAFVVWLVTSTLFPSASR